MNQEPNAQASASSLDALSKTLLIPLCARALAGQRPSLGFDDPFAEQLVRTLGVRTEDFEKDRLSMLGSALRARTIDRCAHQFFRQYPDGLGIGIGAGLCTRFHRVDNGTLTWLDVDLPQVIALRTKFIQRCARSNMLACSLVRTEWLELAKQLSPDRPWFIAAEGVLMFLPKADVEQFFRNVASVAPIGSEIIFDYANARTARWVRTAALRSSGTVLSWGLNSAAEVTNLHERFKLRAGPISFSDPWAFAEMRPYWLAEVLLYPLLRGPITALLHLNLASHGMSQVPAAAAD
jgi:O-methyltransferase involved in polyketide biosynthesis